MANSGGRVLSSGLRLRRHGVRCCRRFAFPGDADDLLDLARSRPSVKTKVTRVGYWHLGTDFIDATGARTVPNAAIEAAVAGTATSSDVTSTLTWEESVEALLGVILDERWYRSVAS